MFSSAEGSPPKFCRYTRITSEFLLSEKGSYSCMGFEGMKRRRVSLLKRFNLFPCEFLL
jgi:hypothetical protein